MKRTLWFVMFLTTSFFSLYAGNENDSLLTVLDRVISERQVYTDKKKDVI